MVTATGTATSLFSTFWEKSGQSESLLGLSLLRVEVDAEGR